VINQVWFLRIGLQRYSFSLFFHELTRKVQENRRGFASPTILLFLPFLLHNTLFFLLCLTRSVLSFFLSSKPPQRFFGNGCHSTSWHWEFAGCIYIGGQLWYQNTTTSSLTYRVGRFVGKTRQTAYANKTQAWLQMNVTQVAMSRMAVSHWGDRLELTNLEATDVMRSAQIFGGECLSFLLTSLPLYSLPSGN
jgi:hypothetical protein